MNTDVSGSSSANQNENDASILNEVDQQEDSLNENASVIDLEIINYREEGDQTEVVDLTKDISGFVDLTKDDGVVQIPISETSKQRRKKKPRKLPYSKNTTVFDDSIEILPSSSSNRQSSDSPPQDPGKKLICPICFDDSDRINRGARHLVSTTCGHVFCNKCLEDSLKLQRKCPTCRKSINNKQFHKLFI